MGDFSGREIKILLGTASRTDDILVARKQELFPLAGGGEEEQCHHSVMYTIR